MGLKNKIIVDGRQTTWDLEDDRVVILQGGCDQASGTYAQPDTKVSRCFLKSTTTNQEYQANSVSSAAGQWTATGFPPLPPAPDTYRLVAIGDHGGMDTTDNLQC
jgi:hypothetical protein